MGNIHAVADDEHVGAGEADEIGVDRDRPLAGLFEQHRGEHAPGAARHQKVLREHQGAAGFEDVVDEQHVAAAHLALDVVQDRDLAGGHRAFAIARQVDELDLGRQPRPVQRADQVRGEHEAALQHRDDEEIFGPGGGDSRASSSLRAAMEVSSKRTRTRGVGAMVCPLSIGNA